MALLSKADREKRFKYLGYDGYNKDNILKFQKKAFPNNKEQQDGKYGINTDRALRHFYNVKKCCNPNNFKPEEFRCNCGHCTGYPSYMKQVELKHLQKIRDHYGKPMTITSGLRCEYENSKQGGVKNSGHLRGYASDIYMKGVTDTVANRQKALKYFESLPNHEFSYGSHMKDSNGLYRTADGMGNAMHTETHKPKEAEKNPIGECANKYAWGIDDADKAKYPSGSPKPAYKKALANVYPNHNKWGTAPSKGASCDVFVGTCVRSAGVDKNFPRGLDEQIDYLPKSPKFKSVSVTTKTVKDGDIIVYAKKGGGAHICIAYGGKTKEAGYEHYYPKTTDYLTSRLSKNGKKWLKVYRAK